MPKKTGHVTMRDPYPWNGAEVLANAAAWSCCGMNLPATYIICPVCEKTREPAQDIPAIVTEL